jgi:hypothetical protein
MLITVDLFVSCKLQHIANLVGNKQHVLLVPAFDVINGGSHARNKLAMQAGRQTKIYIQFLSYDFLGM